MCFFGECFSLDAHVRCAAKAATSAANRPTGEFGGGVERDAAEVKIGGMVFLKR